jgi:hypothetical protein
MVTTQYPTPSATTDDLPVFGEETTAKHRTGTPARELIDALRPVQPLPVPPPVLKFLWDEQRKQLLDHDILRRDLATLLRRRHADPTSVHPDAVESLTKRVDAAAAVVVYLGQAVAAFPSGNRNMP